MPDLIRAKQAQFRSDTVGALLNLPPALITRLLFLRAVLSCAER
jgi:hypothetical protein